MMMKEILFSTVLFFQTLCMYGQGNQLIITNSESGRKAIFSEGIQVRVKTSEKGRLTGRLEFKNDQIILVNSRPVKVGDIEKIKRHPLLLKISNTLFFGYMGFLSSVVLITMAQLVIFQGFSGFILIPFTAISGLSLWGLKASPNLLPAYKKKNTWTFKIQLDE